MYLFDKHGNFKRWNKNFEKITGYTGRDISEMNPLDFFSPEDKIIIKEAIDKLFMEGKVTVESDFLTSSGQKIRFLFTGLKYLEQDNIYLIGVGVDISDRVKAEKEKANLIKELQETLSEVKKLSGLLPICATCKKIRDDNGYWKQIESYILEHSEAKFSHGMCPECTEKYYCDKEWYKKIKNKIK